MRSLVLVVLLWLGGSTALAADEPAPKPQRQHEILQHRPSGFWTSNRAAVGGAYRWRLLYIGVGLASVTGFVMWRLMRRASAERRARSARS
ncbi:MAG: hypothetical protein H0U13_10990 [Gemmatimonadaceae bacterium]|nr:hypothetical protein [Gemmatimonadaceae bacterium]